MRLRNLLIAAGLVSCLVSIGLAISSAAADSLPVSVKEAAKSQYVFQSQKADNSLCLSCHVAEGMQVELDSGESLPLTVNQTAFESSVHGTNQVACVACHTDISSFPHPERTTETLREVTLQ